MLVIKSRRKDSEGPNESIKAKRPKGLLRQAKNGSTTKTLLFNSHKNITFPVFYIFPKVHF